MGVMLNHLPKWCFYLRVGWLSQGWLIISRLADYLKLVQIQVLIRRKNHLLSTALPLPHCSQWPVPMEQLRKGGCWRKLSKKHRKSTEKTLRNHRKKALKKNTELVQFQKPNFKSVCLLSRPAQWKPTITSTLLNNNELPTTIKSSAISNIWKETFPYIRECVTNCLWKLLGLRTSYISRPERPKAAKDKVSAKVQWPKAK